MEKQSDIIQLNYPDSVRTRPGMYLGELDDPSTCLREIVDNSIDECYVSNQCNKIYIYNKNGRAVIIDNGRGIPIKVMKDDPELTMARSSITSLHSGSKFNKTQAQSGMNGVGSSVVNALSNKYRLVVKITKDSINESTELVKKLYKDHQGDFYLVECEKGIVVKEAILTLDELKELVPEVSNLTFSPSTLVEFEPDDTIFGTVNMKSPSTLRYFKYISKSAYGKDVSIFINGVEYSDYFEPYKFQIDNTIYATKEDAKNKEARFLYSFEFDEEFNGTSNIGSVNGLIVNQGYHIWLSTEAFRRAFAKLFPGVDYKYNETRGINFCTIILCPEPSFSSQTKERMSGCDGINIDLIDSLVKSIYKVMNDNYDLFAAHQKRVVEFNLMNANLSKIDYIKSKVPILAEMGERRVAAMTPLRLRKCTTKSREEAELFICEGRSAEGSLAIYRDPRIHASIPLRGKPKNTACSSIEEILENEEMKDIIASIGTGIDEYFNLDRIQYGKIIICSDADPDGSAIAALILGLFLAHMSYLIKEGFVFVCETPLYEQDGELYYLGEEDKLDKNKPIRRFKGLGELPGDIVKKSIFNPESRRLVQVTMDGAEKALALVTNSLSRKNLMINSGIINEH